MPFTTSPSTNFLELSGSIALGQFPNDVFTANAPGRAPFQDGVITTDKILDKTINLIDLDGSVLGLFI